MQFDDLFQYVGEIGIYQFGVSLLLFFIPFLGTESISVNFFAASMDHWCKVPQLQDFPHSHQKYVSIPGSPGSYDSCRLYQLNYSSYSREDLLNWDRDAMITNTTATMDCDNGWVYDISQFMSTIISRYDLVCGNAWRVQLISTIFMVGVFIASLLVGFTSDAYGRKPTIVVFMFFKVAVTFIACFAPNYPVFALGRLLIGIGTTGVYLTAFILVTELVGPVYRTALGCSFQIAFSFGYLMTVGIAHSVRHDRWLQFIQGVPMVLLISFIWVIPESPRWAALKGHHAKADRILKKMAAVNGKELPAHFDLSRIEKEEGDRPTATLLDLFRNPNLRKWTLVQYFYWFSVSLLYFALSTNVGTLSGNLFVNMTISGAVEIPANILCIFACNWKRLGRKHTCIWSMVIAGVSSFLRILMILRGWGTADTALSMVGKAFVTVGYSAIYVYSAELFPTEIRNLGFGTCSLAARISGMGATYAGGPLANVWAPLPPTLFGVFALVAGLLVFLLPETLGHKMFETVAEAEEFGRSKGHPPEVVQVGAIPSQAPDGNKVTVGDFAETAKKQNGEKNAIQLNEQPSAVVLSPGYVNPAYDNISVQSSDL